jgi:hypothetical protein
VFSISQWPSILSKRLADSSNVWPIHQRPLSNFALFLAAAICHVTKGNSKSFSKTNTPLGPKIRILVQSGKRRRHNSNIRGTGGECGAVVFHELHKKVWAEDTSTMKI